MVIVIRSLTLGSSLITRVQEIITLKPTQQGHQ